MNPISAEERPSIADPNVASLSEKSGPIRVLVVGCGRMGAQHALAYHGLTGFRIVGLVSRQDGSRENLARKLGTEPPLFDEFEHALEATRPDAVSISTYPDTHAAFTIRALRAGAHVFVEKPLALSLEDAEKAIAVAGETGRKLMVGLILHHHPAFIKLVELGRTLGRPLVMRMNVNQQSAGLEWDTHRRLLESCSPLVDCGVHYMDLMRRLTGSRPIRVHAIGARLGGNRAENNYGQMQIAFEDGSVGWFESGWGPMISQTAHRIQDVIGPRGSVSLIRADRTETGPGHATLALHRAELDQGCFVHADESQAVAEDPSLPDLCLREQRYFLNTIHSDGDLSGNHRSALESLRMVLAAKRSIETGEVIRL